MESGKSQYSYIVITGAESTGKTELAKDLADELQCIWVPEFSREYVEKLDHPYTYSDVEHIARKQMNDFQTIPQNSDKLVIFDTGLIITKVWFDVVFNKCPLWFEKAIPEMPKVLHLLCDTDLPWVPDKVRENGGEMRVKLSQRYQDEMNKYQIPYRIVSGIDRDRLLNALQYLNCFGSAQ